MTCRRLAYADVLDSGQREALGGVWNDLFAKAGSDPSNAPKVEVRKAVEEGGSRCVIVLLYDSATAVLCL